jgi:hypothetical protein
MFVSNLRKSVIAYQSVLQGPNVPIKEGVWEFILSQAASRSGMSHEWTPGSHRPGADITINGKTYSCKTSRIDPQHLLVSSYRLTNVCRDCKEDPAAIINEIDNVRNNFDSYMILARESKKCKKTGVETILRYRVYDIPSSCLKTANMNWKQDKNGNWKAESLDNTGFSVMIQKSMSFQLWMKIPLAYIEPYIMLTIEIDSVKPVNLVDLYDLHYDVSDTADAFASLSLQSST